MPTAERRIKEELKEHYIGLTTDDVFNDFCTKIREAKAEFFAEYPGVEGDMLLTELFEAL